MSRKEKFKDLILQTSEERMNKYKGTALKKLFIFTLLSFLAQISSGIFYIIMTVLLLLIINLP